MPLQLLGISRTARVARLAGAGATELTTARVDGPMTVLAGRHASRARWVVQGDLMAATVPPLEPRCGPGEHARLLEEIHCRIDVLPVRFGAVLPDERAIQDFLDKRRSELCGGLDRLEGTVEMGLRIELPGAVPNASPAPLTPSPSPSITPADYLAQRRRKYEQNDQFDHQADWLIQRYVQDLEGLCRQWRRLGAAQAGLVRVAFLVQRASAAAFRLRVKAVPTAEGSKCTVVGPWPPYSFV